MLAADAGESSPHQYPWRIGTTTAQSCEARSAPDGDVVEAGRGEPRPVLKGFSRVEKLGARKPAHAHDDFFLFFEGCIHRRGSTR